MDYLFAIVFGFRGIEAAAAFEAAPTNPSAWFYRKAALCLFVLGAFLFLTASVIDVLANAQRSERSSAGRESAACRSA